MKTNTEIHTTRGVLMRGPRDVLLTSHGTVESGVNTSWSRAPQNSSFFDLWQAEHVLESAASSPPANFVEM